MKISAVRGIVSIENKKPVLLMPPLGSLQVYHYQSEEEFKANAPVKQVYWSDVRLGAAYGPFNSLYEAMTHYTEIIASQKVIPPPLPTPTVTTSNVIHVDFRTKKRLK